MAKDTSFYPLTVTQKVAETPDAVTLYFEVPEELKDTFNYDAGQYLTLRFILKGEEERRSYSLSTAPGAGWGVTVKKVKGGKVSTHICDNVKVGNVVEVMPPDGRFTIKPDAERRHNYYFFGAGSGITPLMSQLRTILEREPMSAVHLYYGNRNTESIIFNEELNKLQELYPEQLTVDHTLSKPDKKGGLLGSVFGRNKQQSWAGEKGRISNGKVVGFLEKHPVRHNMAHYYICGPGNMIEQVKQALINGGIDEKAIHAEYFTASDAAQSSATAVVSSGSQATIKLRGEVIDIPIGGKSILETLQDAGYDPPYSCTSGACASCMAKVTSGKADMEMCFALSDKEIADGFVLTCQAHPTTSEISVDYDV